MKATVYSAYPMDADTLESIRPVLEKKFGCELDMKAYTVPSGKSRKTVTTTVTEEEIKD